MTYEEFRDKWAGKSIKAIEKEIASWRSYMQKQTQAYAWHGKGITPPGSIPDGDKLNALREALEIAIAQRGEV